MYAGKQREDDLNHDKNFFDRYESHSSEDRDQSLENLIARLLAAQQQSNNKSLQNHSSSTSILPEQVNPSLIIDDLVDDGLSSISSLSANTPADPQSASPEIAQLLSLHHTVDSSQELNRRERESFLSVHERYRQQTM